MRTGYPAARELRRERMAGNWGGASDHIGRRWEELGMEKLRDFVESGAAWPANGHVPVSTISLAGDDALQLALARSGLQSPDVIVALQDDPGSRTLQALDFKWNLEFASYSQISADALRALLDRGVAPLQSLLVKKLGDGPERLDTTDGLLFSPELPVNRWFLQSEANGRQEYPIENQEVLFQKVDPAIFFQPLPGWEMARLLAPMDRAEGQLRQLEAAEHYYRVGTGLLGSMGLLRVSVFVRQPPSPETTEAFAWFKERVRQPSSDALLGYAERMMSARSVLVTRLKNLTRSPYRFMHLMESLRTRGITLPDREEGLPQEEKERWGELLRRVAVEHKEAVYRAGLRLADTGMSDPDALTRLEAESGRFGPRARGHADRLIAQALQGSAG